MSSSVQHRVAAAYKLGLERINGRLMGSHQHLGVEWMLEREFKDASPGGLLADDCGCGKTYTAICVIKGNPMPPTLIVTTVSLVHQWRDILTSFGSIKPLLVHSDCLLNTVPIGTDVVLTTYSTFTPRKKNADVPKILRNTYWGRVILDEGHIIKNHKSTTFINTNKLNASIRWILSATPVQNTLDDMLTLAMWVGWRDGVESFMEQKMLRRSLATEGEKNPRLKLPKLESEVVRLPWACKEEQQVYQGIEKEFMTRIEQTRDGCMLRTEALQGILRCRQACCHHRLVEGLSRKRQRESKKSLSALEQPSTKFEFICNDIAKNPNEKSIIFCVWTMEIELMMSSLTARDISCVKFDGKMSKETRANTLYNFQNTNIHALIIQIQAGGVGLNLQCATRVYIVSPTWNPTHEIQAISRAYRLGQNKVVRCFRLIIENTVEERMMDIQYKKLEIMADALNDNELMEKMCDSVEIDLRSLFV